MRVPAFAAVAFFAAWGVIDFFTSSKTQSIEPQEQKILTDVPELGAAHTFAIPDSFTFAGEKMPLEYFDVRESLDQELLKVAYWHSEMFLYLKKSYRFFPVIEPILAENNIPDDFKYLMVTESGMRNVSSPAGAKGFWQFMTETAKDYGLEVTREVDERYHLEKATKAACKYLKESYKRYNSWTAAAASYNVGIGNLNKQIQGQGTEDYYDLWLNAETARYLYRIAAVKLIMQAPQTYGFYLQKKDLYPQIETYTVSSDTAFINLQIFAQKNGTNVKVLKTLNPWLRSDKITNPTKRTYKFVIPQKGARSKNYFETDSEADNYINNTEF